MSSRHSDIPRSLQISTTAEDCVETIIYKLSLLNYRQGFLGSKYGRRRTPLDRTWFVTTTTERHAAEMFFTFFNLAAWLVSKFSQINLNPLKEGDDSAAAVRNLLQSLKELNFNVPQTLTASRLQSGCGREVCGVLNGLVDWALESTLFQFKSPEHATEQDDSNVDILEPDLEADMLTQTVPGRPKVLATTMDADLTRLAPMTNKPQSMSRPGTAQCGGDGFMIENRIDRERWDLEYQQVAPKLHIKVTAEARDWRTHLETVLQQLGQAFQLDSTQNGAAATAQTSQNIARASLSEVRRTLNQMQNEVQEQLSKLETHEGFLNNKFTTQTDVYRNKKELLQTQRESFQEQTKEVNDGIMELQKCVHLIEEMQRELEDRSASSTTGVGPVVKIRTAMADLKSDMKRIDVRLGITRHQLLHLQLQNNAQVGG